MGVGIVDGWMDRWIDGEREELGEGERGGEGRETHLGALKQRKRLRFPVSPAAGCGGAGRGVRAVDLDDAERGEDGGVEGFGEGEGFDAEGEVGEEGAGGGGRVVGGCHL